MKFMQVCAKSNHILLKSNSIKWGWLLLALIGTSSYANGHRQVTQKDKTFTITAPTPYKPIATALKNNASLIIATNPPDQIMNVCGTGSTTLTASNIPSGYSNLTWNDGSTGSTLNVNSPGTYWWQVTGPSVVANGDFSQGDIGFTSSYRDVTTTIPNGNLLHPEAAYAVGTNPRNYHDAFYSYGDHTSGSGNMLIVNGASTTDVTVWAENITVTPNTDYVFSVWVRSATQSAPAILQFSIDSAPLGGTITPTSTASTSAWQYFTTTWNSGPNPRNNPIPIALVNQNTAASGNDFAVDDIVFAPVYRQNIVVNYNPIPVLSVISEICGVPSYDLTQTIVGYDPGTYTYTYKDGSGNILSGTQITSAPTGTYTITETSIATGCTSNPQNTTVTINPVPTLSVTSPPTQCGTSYDLKNAINGRDDNTYTYTYQNGATTLGSSVVSASGTYTITATNKTTGCVSNPQPVTVTINPVTGFTVTNQNLPCGVTTYDLYGAITSDKTGYTYIYEDMAGNVLGTGTNFTVTENATTTYQIIEQNASGCQSLPQPVTVTFTPTPVLIVNSPICAVTRYNLQDAIVGSNPTYTYIFKKNGNPNPLTGNGITRANDGTYTITATDRTTGCMSATQTVIINNSPLPTFTLTSPPAQCGTYDLSQAISHTGGTYTYIYQDSGGNILTSSTVNASGTYTITATNSVTGCASAAKTITVIINPLPTLAVSSPPPQCGGSFDLHSAINSPDPTVTYTYSSGASSVVNTSGTYTITATKNGCSTSATVSVNINPLPTLTVSSPSAQCGGTYDLKNAITNYDNSGAYTYSYQNGAATLGSSVVSASGIYTITETNISTGCQSTAPITVIINPIPVLSLSNPPAQCGGTYDLKNAIINYDNSGTYTYTYQNGADTLGSSVVSASGIYTITETNISTGCQSAPMQVTVTINPIPPKPGVIAL